jgi:hypothetical protein
LSFSGLTGESRKPLDARLRPAGMTNRSSKGTLQRAPSGRSPTIYRKHSDFDIILKHEVKRKNVE